MTSETLFVTTQLLRQASLCFLLLSTCVVMTALIEEARVIAWLEEDVHANTAVTASVMGSYHAYAAARWRLGNACRAASWVLNIIGLLFLLAASATNALLRLAGNWPFIIIAMNTVTGVAIVVIFLLYNIAYDRAKRTQSGRDAPVWWSLWVPEKVQPNNASSAAQA